MNLGNYLLHRIVQVPIVVLFITILVFSLIHATPGDPISTMLGVFASPETVEQLQKQFHLDKPLPEQYVLWLSQIVQGDFGESIRTREKVLGLVKSRLPISVGLAFAATILSLVIALPTGIISAYNHNTIIDYVFMTLAMLGLSIPNFALGLILLYIFAVQLGVVPITGIGFTSVQDDFVAALKPYILPAIALGLPQAAVLSRLLRSSMLDVLGQDYIRTARAKGLTDRVVVFQHALKNATIPLVTIVAVNFAYLVGTTITIEFIFAIPGIGTALMQAAVARDFPVIQGITLFTALFFIGANLLADSLYAYLNPRIRY